MADNQHRMLPSSGLTLAERANQVVQGLLLLGRTFLSWLSSLLVPRLVMVGQHRVHFVTLIAEGGFGYVWLAKDVSSGLALACKEVVCQIQEQRTTLRKEIELHDMFSAEGKKHPNIMPLIDYAFHKSGSGERGYILFPLMGRTLQDVLNQQLKRQPHAAPGSAPFFPEPATLHIARGLARALSALHAAGRCHRDLCPRNVLLQEPRDGPGPAGARDDVPTLPHPVLTDFGSAAPVRVSIGTRADAARLADEASQFSSPPYRAPELWSVDPGGDPVGPPADVFSLGCTLFACAFGLSPFESVRNEADGRLRIVEPSHVRTLAPLQFPSSHPFSRPFCELVSTMCAIDARARPTLEQVLDTCGRLLGDSEGGTAGRRGLDDSFV